MTLRKRCVRRMMPWKMKKRGRHRGRGDAHQGKLRQVIVVSPPCETVSFRMCSRLFKSKHFRVIHLSMVRELTAMDCECYGGNRPHFDDSNIRIRVGHKASIGSSWLYAVSPNKSIAIGHSRKVNRGAIVHFQSSTVHTTSIRGYIGLSVAFKYRGQAIHFFW